MQEVDPDSTAAAEPPTPTGEHDARRNEITDALNIAEHRLTTMTTTTNDYLYIRKQANKLQRMYDKLTPEDDIAPALAYSSA